MPAATIAGNARIAAADGPRKEVALPWHLLVLSLVRPFRPRTEQPPSVALCDPPPRSAWLEETSLERQISMAAAV